MKLITDTKLHKVIADEGKHIRSKNDVYESSKIDENGNKIEEHFPSYSEIIYVPDVITEEMLEELFVEEDKGE